MSGTIEIDDMPDLGAVTDTSEIVGEKAGSGLFSAMALRSYAEVNAMAAAAAAQAAADASLPLTGGSVSGDLNVGGLLHATALPVSFAAEGTVSLEGPAFIGGVLGVVGGIGAQGSPTSITADHDVDIGGHLTVAGNVILTGGTLTFTGVSHVTTLVFDALPPTAADDAAAAGLGIPVGGLYRTGSALMVRVA